MAVTTPTRNRSTSPYLNANGPWTCPPRSYAANCRNTYGNIPPFR
jgi:hypothetical protein